MIDMSQMKFGDSIFRVYSKVKLEKIDKTDEQGLVWSRHEYNKSYVIQEYVYCGSVIKTGITNNDYEDEETEYAFKYDNYLELLYVSSIKAPNYFKSRKEAEEQIKNEQSKHS